MTKKFGLFVDNGIEKTGYCIGNLETKEIYTSGLIKTKSNKLIEDRIFEIYQKLDSIIKELLVSDDNNYLDLICLEEPCFNGKNGALLNRSIGAMYVIVGQFKTKYLTINPKTLKRCLTGLGTASKDSMLFYTKKYLPELSDYLNSIDDDETDAYAQYIVYLLNNKIINYVE